MAVVSTLILRSMRMIGEKTRGASLTSSEQTECLAELNSMLDSWSLDKLMCYTVTQDSYLLSASTAIYTIGPGATISTARPIALRDPCWVRDSNSVDYPLKIINLESYGTLTDKSSGALIPSYIYYDAAYSATSTASLTLYPPPSAGLTLYIHSLKQQTNFSSVTQVVMYPPGYQLAIESNLAIHLAAGFRPVSAEVAKIAKESLANIKRNNAPAMIARLEAGSAIGTSINHGIYIDSEYIE